MPKLPTPDADQELYRLSEQFEQWRATKLSRSESIPQPLWDKACELTERLSVWSVAKRLNLSGQDLKRQRERFFNLAGTDYARPMATFVSAVIEPPPVPSNAEYEVHRADGVRLCIRSRAPIAEVVRAFLAG